MYSDNITQIGIRFWKLKSDFKIGRSFAEREDSRQLTKNVNLNRDLLALSIINMHLHTVFHHDNKKQK